MKKSNFVFALVALLFWTFAAHAQVPSVSRVGINPLNSQIVSILDTNASGLGLTGDQSSKLKANNKSFVSELMNIADGSGSEESKKSSILNLKNNRVKFLNELMGNDLAQKYLGKVLKGINPLKPKLGLAALAF
jgi:hypothetical protein